MIYVLAAVIGRDRQLRFSRLSVSEKAGVISGEK
jgi:hypothetical protein